MKHHSLLSGNGHLASFRSSLFIFICLLSVLTAEAKKKYPEIKFEKTTIDLGTFRADDAKRKCTFTFYNVGNAPLIINYVHTSCGCTVAQYPTDAIPPGGKGEIQVSYDGSGKMPGKFKKGIQIFSNCKTDLAQVFIIGEMKAVVK